MTLSGDAESRQHEADAAVLIPLLVDDPLWAIVEIRLNLSSEVLIPLLVDDPLWELIRFYISRRLPSLNPSFSGWPSLGRITEKEGKPF